MDVGGRRSTPAVRLYISSCYHIDITSLIKAIRYLKIYLALALTVSYLTIYLLTGELEMHRHCESHEGRWAAGRHHRRGRHGGFGFGGRHGGGMNPGDMRARRG